MVGPKIAQAFDYFGIKRDPNNLCIFSDTGIDIGYHRIVAGTSFYGHQGLKSIASSMNQEFDGFTRLGIGVGTPQSTHPQNVGKFFN